MKYLCIVLREMSPIFFPDHLICYQQESNLHFPIHVFLSSQSNFRHYRNFSYQLHRKLLEYHLLLYNSYELWFKIFLNPLYPTIYFLLKFNTICNFIDLLFTLTVLIFYEIIIWRNIYKINSYCIVKIIAKCIIYISQ